MSRTPVSATSPDPPPGWRRGYWLLMATQFQGVFSDNALKQLVIFLAMARNPPRSELYRFVSEAALYFAAPFLVLAAIGGWMADRFSKAAVIRGVKISEIAIIGFATVALAGGGSGVQLAAVGLMGAHSALFSASKYGSLPEIVPLGRLSLANGVLEMLTFLAATLGTLAAGFLATRFAPAPAWAGLILMGLAVAGYATSLGVLRLPAAAPHKPFRINFLRELWDEFRWMRSDRDLWSATLGNAVFYFLASLVQMNLLLYADRVLKVDPLRNSTVNVALALGIGAGSLLAGKLSRERIEHGLIPAGACLMTGMSIILGWPGVPVAWFVAALVLLGVGGGLFMVPVVTALQHRPPAHRRGAVQGAASWLSWVGILLASVIHTKLTVDFGWSTGHIFWVCGLLAGVSGTCLVLSRPDAFPAMVASWRSRAK